MWYASFLWLHLFLVRFLRLKSTYSVFIHFTHRKHQKQRWNFDRDISRTWYSNDHSWKRCICTNVYNIGRWYAKRVKRWCMFSIYIYIYVDTYLTATVTHSERLWSETPVKSVKREKMLDWLTTVPIAHVILQRLRIIFRDGSFDIERAERKVWLLLDKLYHGLHH